MSFLFLTQKINNVNKLHEYWLKLLKTSIQGRIYTAEINKKAFPPYQTMLP